MKISVVPIGLRLAFIPIITASLCFLLNWIIAGVIFVLTTFFILYFFRDPERKVPNIPNAIISPADGKVLSVEKIKSPEFPNGEAIRIKIFLSIFNVHIQRSPIKGNIFSVIYSPGKFFNALKEKCSEDNENNLVGIKNDKTRVLVKQIAGVIARRIICLCRIGDSIERGDKLGLICFGSRVETYFPSNVEVRIKPGMKVYGGKSILGIVKEE